MPEWDTDSGGLLTLKPLVGWETAILTSRVCGLRVEFVHRSEEIGKPPEAIQIAMLPKRARALAANLIEMAKELEVLEALANRKTPRS